MPNLKPSSPKDEVRGGVDPVERNAAAAELLVRRRARASILDYANAIDVPGRPVGDDADSDDCDQFAPLGAPLAAHHRLILERAEATSRTPHGRLMIFTPPGAGKSTYASVVFPSWYLGAAPNRKLILASYGDALASRMGRRTRSIARQARWQRIWETELAADSHAAHAFAFDERQRVSRLRHAVGPDRQSRARHRSR
jgi:hypothetical protein